MGKGAALAVPEDAFFVIEELGITSFWWPSFDSAVEILPLSDPLTAPVAVAVAVPPHQRQAGL